MRPRRLWSNGCGRPACRPRRSRFAIPRPCCRNGRRRAVCRRRPIARLRAPALITTRYSASPCSCQASARPKARDAPSGAPSRPPLPQCSTARASRPRVSMAEAAASGTRCGFVALIGAPNVGKSTLLNALVGAKISIVTPKVQTNRAVIRGIATDGPAQLIFVDTPGIFAPRRRLDRAMVSTAWRSAADADVVALLIDARKGVAADDEGILGMLADVRSKKILVLNKVDLVDKPVLLTLAGSLNERMAFAATFMV